jgi:acetyl-CoA C-acetyltransferase
VRAVLGRAGRKLGDVSLVEINEAFAAMPLVSTKLLAASEGVDLAWLRERTNAQGGAIAVGHPVAASGLRLALTLAGALRRGGGGRGVAAICGGLSQGEAVLLEV